MNKHISIILCQTSHPGNLGATARAMKNMGLTKLMLVAPLADPLHQEAISRASGAEDVLYKAPIFPTLEEAIASHQWVFATSARQREFVWPQTTAREAVVKMNSFCQLGQEVAIVFGNEQSGLSNKELQNCDYHIYIPTHPYFPSLNLAAAVQIIAYEIYQFSLSGQKVAEHTLGVKATQQEFDGFIAHFIQTAIKGGFLDPHHPKKMVPRIKRIFKKAQLEQEDIHLLRGFLKMIGQLSE